jgi:hypothetical protein
MASDKKEKPRSTAPGDVVLIHLREQPATFARVEAIRPHERREWFYCDLLVLAVPTQPVTWILQRHQIDGTPFTMGGEAVRIDRLPDPGTAHGGPAADEEKGVAPPARKTTGSKGRSRHGKVVSLFRKDGSEADRT